MHSYARAAGTVAVALGLALVKDAWSLRTLLHALSIVVLLVEVELYVGVGAGVVWGCLVFVCLWSAHQVFLGAGGV